MKIEGMGNVTKKEVLTVFSSAYMGRKFINEGLLTWEQAGVMYKNECVRKFTKIGRMGFTYNKIYDIIPFEVWLALSPEHIGLLMDAIYDALGRERRS